MIDLEFKTKEALYLAELLSAALTDKAPSVPSDDFDFDFLYDLSVIQKVEAMAYIGLSKCDAIPDSVIDKFENGYKKEIAYEMIRHAEGRRILKSLESGGVDCIPLKGWVIKSMYPQPAMRYMCDIDILFKKEKADAVREILESLGFSVSEFGGNPDVYMKKPILNIEMHKALIQDKTDHFEKTWERAVLSKNTAHTYTMTLEDYYIYMMAHLRKHFYGSGTGVRSICDIFVFLQTNQDVIDRNYIDEKLKKSGILEFDKKVRRLCDVWFNGLENTDEMYDFGMRFLRSGAFGTEETVLENTMANELNSVKGSNFILKKIRYILQLAFPKISIMENDYKYLKKLPILLPIAWIQRGLRSVFKRKNATRKLISEAVSITKDRAEKRN